MITIALDEQGDFENLKRELNNKPVFIGGIVYDDGDEAGDYENEKRRLHKYLKNVCANVGCRYPQDLHVSKDEHNDVNVKKVKIEFSNTIEEFLEKGTWNNSNIISNPRKGKYYIFAFLRGDNGKRNLLSPDVSEVVRESFASNLYVHMAEDVVERLIFHNPIIPKMGKVRLELATRRVILEGTDRTTRMKEYEQLGYKEIQREGVTGKTEFLLTNPDIYRTAIEREMLRCDQKKILVDRIGVKSIYYENEKKGMDFLYLADAICSYLGYKVPGNKAHQWIKEFFDRSKKINDGVKNLIWGYDAVDDYFSKAWKYLEEGDYYKALSVAFDGSKYKSEMTSFYVDNWFGYIGSYISRKNDISGFSMAVKKYRESMFNNNLNQEKLVYIYKSLEAMSKNIVFSNKKEESELYDLYDCGVSAYIHTSNLAEAKECFEKTKQYAEYIPTESFLRTRNKMVVFLCDNLQFEEALELADENVTYQELLTEMKCSMFGDSFSEALGHAITISQRGQVYALMKDNKAETDFTEALRILDEDTPDRYITMSYLLHYYIDNKEREKYEQLAKEYFGGNTTLAEQFNYMVREGTKEKNAKISLKYALYLFVKAAYVFYIDEMPTKLLNKFKNIEKSLGDVVKNAEKQVNGHPWEVIYKYLILIMIVYKCDAEKDMYKSKLQEMFNDSEGLIKDIFNESKKCIETAEANGIYENKYTYMYT